MPLRSFHLLLSIMAICFCSSNEAKNSYLPEIPGFEKKIIATDSYDLQHPQMIWELPKKLKEISGQTWVDKNHLLAIEDLNPRLYLLRIDDSKIDIEKIVDFEAEPDKKFDIEDVCKVDNVIYALWSHGSIFRITDWETHPNAKEYSTNLSKENNTEGLCYDPVSRDLLIACKNESDIKDAKKSTRSIFEFDLKKNSLKNDPFLLIHKKDFAKFANEKLPFYPSAIAVHPITHDIYILSTKDTKCMACYSYDGKLKSLQFIQKELMPQPEGICFAPDGTLFISTEGKHGDKPAILKFKYTK